MPWLGLDIGGANIKAADGRGFALTQPFPLWQAPSQLSYALREVIAQSPASDHLAVSMTGELADCFATKTEGVCHILAAVEQASDGRHVRVYTVQGRWLALPAARRLPLECAAANWHALARFAARYLDGDDHGWLIDIGSTTTDLVPLERAGPRTPARTDLERTLRGELLYCGVVRSPVCGVVRTVPYRGQEVPVALELFATMRDVYTVLGDLPEDSSDLATADGRPATKVHARARLARMLCADNSEFHHRDAVVMAEAAREEQVRAMAASVRRAAELAGGEANCVVSSGSGEFLVRRVLDELGWQARRVSLACELGQRVSVAATAHALAVLASGGSGE